MFRLLPGVRPAQTQAERDARRRLEQRRTALGDEVAQWRLVPADDRNQVDGWDSARAMIIFHMYNPNVRRYLYRAHIADPEEMEARLVRNPDVTGWGTKMGEESPMIPPEFWVEFFTFVRLDDWNIDEVKNRVVLKRDFLTLEPIQRRPDRDTKDFILFYRALWQWISIRKRNCFPCKPRADLVLRDVVLLYFVRCCLLHKNGRAVLNQSHFDWMGEKGRDVVWSFLEEADPRLEETRLDDRDYLQRVAPLQESWDNLLRMFSFGMARRYTLCEKDGAICAVPVDEGDNLAPPERTEQDVVEETPGEPPALPAREDVEGEEMVQKELDAEECPLHTQLREEGDHLCPSTCCRPNSQNAVSSSPWLKDLKRCASKISDRKLQQAGVMLAVGAEQPNVTKALLRHHDAPTETMRPHQTGGEWSAAVKGFQGAPEQDKHAMESVDALAQYGGWRCSPQSERLARYATVYGAGDRRDQAWVSSGWTMNSELARRLDTWKNANPKPSHRTLQMMAACLQ